MSGFQFKQFFVEQDGCAMKVGTDGVLLGAWTPSGGKTILDIGTGSGLIALMMAQRYPSASIYAIEIDHSAWRQAVKNFENSQFSSRITARHTSLQSFSTPVLFDTIVCNPPFFDKSLHSPDAGRTTARHTASLSYNDLALHSSRLMTPNASLSIILPYSEALAFIALARKHNLYPTKITHVHPTPGSETKRLLVNLTNNASSANENPEENHITIEIARHQYSPEYIEQTRDFYMKM